MTPAAFFTLLAVVAVSFEAPVVAAVCRVLARGARRVSIILRLPMSLSGDTGP
jgi:hypothetical protein